METPAAETPAVPESAQAALEAAGLGRALPGGESLPGGMISLTRRVRTDRGHSVVLKQCVNHSIPHDLYAREAEGLNALRIPGAPRVPGVYAFAEDFIVMEDLGAPISAVSDTAWEAFGHALAVQHRCTAPRFGFEHDNYLGIVPQRNAWTDDAVGQWIEERVLHYLPLPIVQKTLTAEQRRGVERFCAFARRHIPTQPPALLHGDLWYANALITQAGEPATLDPAVYFGLPEVEISLTRQWGHFEPRFYDAYAEHGILLDGWQDRLEFYYIAQLVGIIAHVGDHWPDVIESLDALIQKYCG
ncbi:MAG: fructosamine kinase family protein [Tepidisphaeraceae bacterium]